MSRVRDVDAAFSASLRRLRAARKMSMRDLAARCDLAHSVIARIEDGQPPTLGFALAIAAALGVSLEDMTGPAPCVTCQGIPPAGFACLSCGKKAAATEAECA